MWKPVGNRLLIKKEEIKEKIGSFYLPDEIKNKERLAICKGIVLAMGNQCYIDYEMRDVQTTLSDGTIFTERQGRKWCEVGDEVLYQPHAGMRIPDPGSPQFYVPELIFILDKDVVAVKTKEESLNG